MSSVALLKSHLKRDHTKQTGFVVIRQSQQVLELTKLKCGEESCGHQAVSSIPDLKKHLYKAHTEKKEEIQCIFCAFKTNVTSSLQSHLSRKHKSQTVNELNASIVDFRESENDEDLNRLEVEIEGSVAGQGESLDDSFEIDNEIDEGPSDEDDESCL